MKLSIIIVNYNVKYFLEQCLNSVFVAAKNIPTEVFVVDNNSSDGSESMVKNKFPQVHFIANKNNVGFSKANNQAIKLAQGEYVLLLNPDTVVEENTFTDTLAFMDSKPNAGCLGIKMIDGKGHYLPESKRGLPTPWVAFYKIFGFTKLFPKSKKFARYYHGYLSENENNEIEILAGAFMLMRKKALDKIGLLDETFFMYGEDIDLSYRFILAGYKNYYFADSSIIHYKGESTKKGSLNYVYVFYKAMIIFAEKHFSSSYAAFFRLFILAAIYLRGGISILKRAIIALTLPVIDFSILIVGLYYIKEYWENNHRFVVGGEYHWDIIKIAFPLYALGWVIGIFLNGGYEKPTRVSQLLKGIFTGSLAIIVGYSLVNEEYRFSRAILLLGAIWATFSIPLLRIVLQKLSKVKLLSSAIKSKRIFIIGSENEISRIEKIAKGTNQNIDYIGHITPHNSTDNAESFLGNFNNLYELITTFNIDEIIFCAKDISTKNILKKMVELKPLDIEVKIAPINCNFVIGSNSIDTQGAWYGTQSYDLSQKSKRRSKRILDLTIAIIAFLFSPILIGFVSSKAHYYKNIVAVLTGHYSWISYNTTVSTSHLPKLRKGILKTTENLKDTSYNKTSIQHLNELYAKTYTPWSDLNFLIHNFNKIGNP